jgi:hypothetical protein
VVVVVEVVVVVAAVAMPWLCGATGRSTWY